MATTYKEMVAAARAKIDIVPPAEASRLAASGGATILDVREPDELVNGRVGQPFLHIPRGFLEPRADEGSGLADPGLLAAKGAPVLVLCGLGGRAALATATLRDMGYDARLIEGGFKAWSEAGLPSAKG